MFTLNANDCPLVAFDVIDLSGGVVSTSDPIYSRLSLATRSALMGDIMIDTTTTGTNDLRTFITFHIQARTSGSSP